MTSHKKWLMRIAVATAGIAGAVALSALPAAAEGGDSAQQNCTSQSFTIEAGPFGTDDYFRKGGATPLSDYTVVIDSEELATPLSANFDY